MFRQFGFRSSCFAALVALSLGTAAFVAADPITFQYTYDDNGRLTNAVDSVGNVIGYNYDPVGNIVSITRSGASPSSLAIFSFNPQSVAAGATITLQGQNFATPANANTVLLNGIAAPVIGGTSSQLTVMVPLNATTGTISVTANGMTAVSVISLPIVPLPSITTIAPAFALQGTAAINNVSVAGSNLAGSTFSFSPAFVPPAVVPSNVAVSADGRSATMTLSLSATAVGTFTLGATNAAGASSFVPTSTNTLTIISTDPTVDADGDGLSNVYELALGSNPSVASTSGSGIPDGWAVYFSLNPLNAAAAGSAAPDGLTYLQAYQQGLNPTIPSIAAPVVNQIVPANGATHYPPNGAIVVRFSTLLQVAADATTVQNALSDPVSFPLST